jgi:hypothetical protein
MMITTRIGVAESAAVVPRRTDQRATDASPSASGVPYSSHGRSILLSGEATSMAVRNSPITSAGAARTGPDQWPSDDAKKLTIVRPMSTSGTPRISGARPL